MAAAIIVTVVSATVLLIMWMSLRFARNFLEEDIDELDCTETKLIGQSIEYCNEFDERCKTCAHFESPDQVWCNIYYERPDIKNCVMHEISTPIEERRKAWHDIYMTKARLELEESRRQISSGFDYLASCSRERHMLNVKTAQRILKGEESIPIYMPKDDN